MHIYMIDAYGGPGRTDGAIHHFGVQADSAEEAVELVRSSESGQNFVRFDVVEVGEEVEGEQPEIIAEAEGSYGKSG